MITLEDCIALCGLSEEEVLAIAEHEHIPEIAATELAEYLLMTEHGTERICAIIVDDIRAAIAELESRGVVFADYDLPGFRTVGHVCVLGSEKAAWFNDPEGNILCLHEDIPSAAA